uniref:Uncharacterized protein n=1 Tax=Picea glauca TaxID=3330 RepID=A0A101LYC4_PICGL|nr:hypothetical protein ABT39_MTgene5816 [Picea glauca]
MSCSQGGHLFTALRTVNHPLLPANHSLVWGTSRGGLLLQDYVTCFSFMFAIVCSP